jgi:hypothetical protein
MREWLIGVYLYCADYHEGWFNGRRACEYRWLCESGELLSRWYQIRDPFEWLESSCIKPECQAAAKSHYDRFVANGGLRK